MALNMSKHIYSHKGLREYTGEEGTNLFLGQNGVDILTNAADMVTAGEDGTTSKINNVAADMTDRKLWVSITVMGDGSGTNAAIEVQFMEPSGTPSAAVSIAVPVGTTIFGPFYKIDATNGTGTATVGTNSVALYCLRG
jgi:hypothetical protein